MTDSLRRKRLDGYCHLTEDTGGSWYLPRSEFSKVRTAWLKGAAFVDTVGFHGDALTIKMANVDSIADVAPEVIASSRAEIQADEVDDALTGGAS